MSYTSSFEKYSSSKKDGSSKSKDNKGYAYKKSAYQYSSSDNNALPLYQNKSADQNIDQLDALLEDLKNERQITREKDIFPLTAEDRTKTREIIEPGGGTITKTTRIIKTSKQSDGGHHLLDDIENYSTSDYSTIQSNGYTSQQNTLRRDNYQTDDNTFQTRTLLPDNVYESKNIYESKRTINNSEVIPSTITSKTTQMEKDLENIALSDDILPLPGTKVTTTVRTYTYEVPANASNNNTLSNRNQIHNTVKYNTLQYNTDNTIDPHSYPSGDTPQTVSYSTESYSTMQNNNERPVHTNRTYEIREQRESNTVRNHLVPQPYNSTPSTGGTKTIVYNVNTTENIHNVPPSNQFPHNEIHPVSPVSVSPNNYYPPGIRTNKYTYQESSNIVNTIHQPVLPNEPNVTHSPLTGPRRPGPDSHLPPSGPNTSTVSYKYSSSTTNNRRGPEFGAPPPITTHLSPFPIDGIEIPIANGNTPQKVDDLMQSFGNADVVDKTDIETPHRKREIETAVATTNQQVIPSVNKAGKEVYYPPGHEVMITKREEMAAGSAGGGRWAKGSGMYEYESGYKSETKTKSGAAVVPLCLPLCCGMPCSIM